MGNNDDAQKEGGEEYAVEVTNFSFAYPNSYGKEVQALEDVNFKLKRGARCLLLGQNGAGKSTVLRVLAGKHLHKKEEVIVLGTAACYQTGAVSGVSYLGASGWTRSIAFAGNNVAFEADIPVKEMMLHLQEKYPERRDELYKLLDINPEWRMHMVSDGQRRRVRIMLGLLRPFNLLLLDEVTVDLDVVVRADFLAYLKRECEERGATIIYATHIFDGMDEWPTDLVLLDKGRVLRNTPYGAISSDQKYGSLYKFVEASLRELRDQARAEQNAAASEADKKGNEEKPQKIVPFADRPNCGYTPGRLAEMDL
ncbi:ABC transporter I family member 20 [Hondaea fermentalgiana]|uniref:ABC transporter I family member 20 n=1 Tax=Hondaea fermentalgiana TaxID=2315210 RepID=A0A2R5GBY6_9STRA|nr:ABC transporter I family member 20 [Hondaea fermentalgiana]|eukprot:GBG28497.1 ABC transporter I family member 20 [Hondaea fermentalgiana]